MISILWILSADFNWGWLLFYYIT